MSRSHLTPKTHHFFEHKFSGPLCASLTRVDTECFLHPQPVFCPLLSHDRSPSQCLKPILTKREFPTQRQFRHRGHFLQAQWDIDSAREIILQKSFPEKMNNQSLLEQSNCRGQRRERLRHSVSEAITRRPGCTWVCALFEAYPDRKLTQHVRLRMATSNTST